MFPEIHILGLTIYPYGMMIGIGLILAILTFVKRCKNSGLDEDSSFNLALTVGICGILGAKLLYILLELPKVIEDPSILIKEFSTGFVFYGGVILGVLTGYIYIRIKKWDFLKMLDLAIPSVPLAHGFGRIGCFFAGCCYGKETDSFLGMEFNNSPFAPHNVSLYPTQIMSSIGNFIIFLVLLWYDKNKREKDGQTGALYLILYSIFRFLIEFLRGDPRGTVFGLLSTSQFICLFAFAAGIILMVRKAPARVEEGALEEAPCAEESKEKESDS